MFEPPYFCSRFCVQNTLPVAASSDRQVAARPEHVDASPSTVGVLRGPSAAIVAEPPPVARPPTAACRSPRRTPSRTRCPAARAERVQPPAGDRERRIPLPGAAALPRQRRSARRPLLQQPASRRRCRRAAARATAASRRAPRFDDERAGSVTGDGADDDSRDESKAMDRCSHARSPRPVLLTRLCRWRNCLRRRLRLGSGPSDSRADGLRQPAISTSRSAPARARSATPAPRRSPAPARSPRRPPSRRRPGRTRCTCRRASWRRRCTMKNEVVALAGSSPRAIETMPLTCFVSLNSGCSVAHQLLLLLGQRSAGAQEAGLDAKPFTTRWNDVPSRRPRRPGAGSSRTCSGALSGKNSMVIGPAEVSSTAR